MRMPFRSRELGAERKRVLARTSQTMYPDISGSDSSGDASINKQHPIGRGQAATFAAALVAGLIAMSQALRFAREALAGGVGVGEATTVAAIASSAEWTLLAGAIAPAAAVAWNLHKFASTRGPAYLRSQMASRLHSALVLSALAAAGVLLAAASRAHQLVSSFWVGTLGFALAGTAVAGALHHFPFDIPTALALWLVPRDALRWRGQLSLTLLTLAAWLGLAEGAAAVLSSVGGGHHGGGGLIPTLRGLRGALSVVAALALAALRDAARRRRRPDGGAGGGDRTGGGGSSGRASREAALVTCLSAYAATLVLVAAGPGLAGLWLRWPSWGASAAPPLLLRASIWTVAAGAAATAL